MTLPNFNRLLLLSSVALMLSACAHKRPAPAAPATAPAPTQTTTNNYNNSGFLVTSTLASAMGPSEQWQLNPTKGDAYTLTLAPDGLVTSSHGHRGLWTRNPAGTHIKWQSGAYVLVSGSDYAAYASDYGLSGTMRPVETGSAKRTQP